VIREASLSDILFVAQRMRERDWKSLRCMIGELSADSFACDKFSRAGVCWAITNGSDLPVIVGGIADECEGIGTWWMVATDDIEKSSKSLIRLGRTAVRNGLARGGYRRIQAYVMEDWPEAQAVAARIGLEREGVLRGIGANGENVVMMAAVR
jgi:hypothetical protein